MNMKHLPQDPEPWDVLEESLLHVLAAGSIKDEQARALVSELSKIDVLTSYPIRPFPKGIVTFDGLGVELVLDQQGLERLSGALQDVRHLDRFEYFPYGIVNPRTFVSRVELRLR